MVHSCRDIKCIRLSVEGRQRRFHNATDAPRALRCPLPLDVVSSCEYVDPGCIPRRDDVRTNYGIMWYIVDNSKVEHTLS